MNNKEYTWIFDSSALPLGIDGNFSLEYHVPFQKLKAKPSEIIGSKLWLILKDGEEYFLYALLVPSTVEMYTEGKYKGDFLLFCELFYSVRFLPRFESRASWKLPLVRREQNIEECPGEESQLFRSLIKKNKRVSFSSPSRAITKSVPETKLNDIRQAVCDQLILTLRSSAYGDISLPRAIPLGLSAFGALALTILLRSHPEFEENELINFIADLDPLGKNEDILSKSREKVFETANSLPPMVDIFLEEIDIEKIVPRTFVAGLPGGSLESLDKTNNAEEIHEKIVKDLSLTLKENSFQVYKSRSFDLFTKRGGNNCLWEVKSANKLNCVAQCEKGIIQLLHYSMALSDDISAGPRLVLLLQDTHQSIIQSYLSKLASRVGIELWFYNETRNWPFRIFDINNRTFFSNPGN